MCDLHCVIHGLLFPHPWLRSALLLRPIALRLLALAARRSTLAAFEGRCICAGSLRFCVAYWANGSAMRPAKRLASPALRPSRCSPGRIHGPLRRALPVRRSANRTPTAFARRSIPAGPLRSALLLGPIALWLLALAARRSTLAAFEGRCICAGSLRFCVASWANGSAMRPAKRLASPALRPSRCSPGRIHGPLRRALPAGRFAGLGARPGPSTDRWRFAARARLFTDC